MNNLDCANCAIKIEDHLLKTTGVSFASVDFASSTLFLDAEDISTVKEAISSIEPEIEIIENGDLEKQNQERFNWRELAPILIASGLFLFGILFYSEVVSTPFRVGEYLVFGIAYGISGWRVLYNAARNILHGRIFDEHFLMSIATIGAVIIGEIPEAAGVMIFYMIGDTLQQYSVKRSRRSIQALLETRPDQASLMENGKTIQVKPEMVRVGQKILVKPGEKIPLDGIILQGTSYVDTSPLTGESKPVSVRSGDEVLAGSINKNGLLTLRVERPFGDSSISRMLDLVEKASSRKASTEKFITKFAKIYSPIVVMSALAVAVIPPLVWGADFNEWVYRALVVLVISCPCALVISIPLGYFGGIGGASRRGILVKGSSFLDSLAAVKTVIFDKTGTLTKGVFEVTKVHPRNGYDQNDLLRLAAQAEVGSNHPIAQSIRNAYEGESIEAVDETHEMAGHGVRTILNGQVILAGNDSFMHKNQVTHELDLCNQTGTLVHVAVDNKYAGYIKISDEMKVDAREAVESLRSNGISRLVMLTGDNQEIAREVAHLLGFDEFQSELLPEEKTFAVEEILKGEKNSGNVAFVGDGINDAPALARADVGIAMGALGSAAAIESADVVIMTDSPVKVAEAIKISRKTRSIVWQNIFIALVVKTFFITMGIAGAATMWQAVFGDMGVAILAVLNASRALVKDQ